MSERETAHRDDYVDFVTELRARLGDTDPRPSPLRPAPEPEPVSEDERASGAEADQAKRMREAFELLDQRAGRVLTQLDELRADIRDVRTSLTTRSVPSAGVDEVEGSSASLVLRWGVLALLAGLFGMAIWARSVDYALRVTSDTPTFIALIGDMAKRPFGEQSPFLPNGVATQHATPYLQALALLWRGIGGGEPAPIAIGRFLALVGVAAFAFTIWCVFLYTRRLAGSTAGWIVLPVLLGVFGPPHVIWASDLSLHAALYASFFPQNLAIGLTLLTMLALTRGSRGSLELACVLAGLAMVVHPFTGVLLCVLAAAQACRLAFVGDRAATRAPITLAAGFAIGSAWPSYSLDSAFRETGVRGIVFVALCALAPAAAFGIGRLAETRVLPDVSRPFDWIESSDAAYRLALFGGIGTVAIAAWELALVHWPPAESARLAIYWVDERWRWPLLFVAGTAGLSGLARLARRGHVVPAVWFSGCFALGTLGAIGLPLPVWYRFLLLCQIPLAIGVAVVVVEAGRSRTSAIVAATFAVTIAVKVLTLVAAPPKVSYFGESLQPSWALGAHIGGGGLVATDPRTAYFIPAVTGDRVLTVDKGHVSSSRERATSAAGYALLRRYYAGGPDWWTAAQQMWRRGVRYVVVEKHTTLEPRTLDDFIWQTAELRTDAQRRALGNYFYENNRIGKLVFDSRDYAVYRIDAAKLFPRRVAGERARRSS